MKKYLAAVAIGLALLLSSQNALAEGKKSSQPRWGITAQEKGAPSERDFARWLSVRFGAYLGVGLPPTATPTPIPAPTGNGSTPPSADSPCAPEDLECWERVHSPIG